MRNLILFAAMSLDGYLAKSDHAMDWLSGDNPETSVQDPRYYEFYQNIDTLIMGRITYEQIVQHLSPKVWPYPNKLSYIISRHPHQTNNQDAIFTDKSSSEFIQELKKGDGSDIWLVGGAQLIKYCIYHNLIDKYIISIIPTLLGEGIPLFLPQNIKELPLKFQSSSTINGISELTYLKR